MTTKKYGQYRLIIVILLSVGISSLVSSGNYLIPLIGVVLAMIILYSLRQQVQGVLADECDYSLAGQAARYSLFAFSLILTFGFFILMQFAGDNQELRNLAMVFSYLVCALLLINAGIFQYLHMRLQLQSSKLDRKMKLRAITLYLIIALFIASIIVGGLRLFSGEDTWICRDGQWQQHGQPDSPMPTSACLK